MTEDKELECIDCLQPFVFTVGEQAFYMQKGLKNDPKRCLRCREQKKSRQSGRYSTEPVSIQCNECEVTTYINFKPTGKSPVYCLPCLIKRRDEALDGTDTRSQSSAENDQQRIDQN